MKCSYSLQICTRKYDWDNNPISAVISADSKLLGLEIQTMVFRAFVWTNSHIRKQTLLFQHDCFLWSILIYLVHFIQSLNCSHIVSTVLRWWVWNYFKRYRLINKRIYILIFKIKKKYFVHSRSDTKSSRWRLTEMCFEVGQTKFYQ